MPCEFSLEHYFETLAEYKKAGYRFSTLSKPLEGKTVYLRHDVDISINSAEVLAIQEQFYGVKSTYHVMISSPYYNLFERTNIEKLKHIAMLGHEIGLHFDGRYPYIRKQVELLSAFSGYQIKSVSQDGLFGSKHENIIVTDEIIDASTYPAKYLSDSCMHWREGCFCQHISKYEQMQILAHPEWWVQADQTSQLIKKFREHMKVNNHD